MLGTICFFVFVNASASFVVREISSHPHQVCPSIKASHLVQGQNAVPRNGSGKSVFGRLVSLTASSLRALLKPPSAQITDILHRHTRIGDAVGTLGFADELVVLIMSPLSGYASDKIGVRPVSALLYLVLRVQCQYRSASSL